MLDLGGLGPPVDAYPTEAVRSLTIVEPDPAAAAARRERAATHGLDVDVVASVDELSAGERFDTVVSVCALAPVGDLPTALARAAARLAPEGSLHLVEPTLAPGAWRTLVTPLVAALPTVAGLHLNRDVPSAVRAQGLTVVAIERFTMPTVIWPLRPFVTLTARRIEAAAAPEDQDR